MSNRSAYSYVVLRYVHDVATGEFVNVGVVLHCPKRDYLKARVAKTYGRASAFFPGMVGDHYRRVSRLIETELNSFATSLSAKQARSITPPSNAAEFAAAVFPRDDSSFQWSHVGAGTCLEPAKILEELFCMLVTKYERLSKERRDDSEVWQLFSKALAKRQIADRLEPVEIVSTVDKTKFKHAWKNGVWHCLEPLSFDLIDGEAIRQKAHRTLGQLTALKNASEPFKVYLLIGEPKHEHVATEYARARKILDSVPIEKEIYTEDEADQFSARLAQQMQLADEL